MAPVTPSHPSHVRGCSPSSCQVPPHRPALGRPGVDRAPGRPGRRPVRPLAPPGPPASGVAGRSSRADRFCRAPARDATLAGGRDRSPPDGRRHSPHGADMISAAAALSKGELVGGLDLAFRQKAAAEGKIVVLMGEVNRRQATATMGRRRSRPGPPSASGSRHRRHGRWAPGREGLGHAPPGRVALCGDLSLDKVRAVADVATPETDQGLCDAGQGVPCESWPIRPLPRSPSPAFSALRARPPLPTLQRRVPHHERAAPPRVLRRDPDLPRGPGPRRSPPTARRRGTSASVTPSWRSSALRPRAHRAVRHHASPYFVVVHVPLAPWSKRPARRASWRASSSVTG